MTLPAPVRTAVDLALPATGAYAGVRVGMSFTDKKFWQTAAGIAGAGVGLFLGKKIAALLA